MPCGVYRIIHRNCGPPEAEPSEAPGRRPNRLIATPSEPSVVAGAWTLLGFLREPWQSAPGTASSTSCGSAALRRWLRRRCRAVVRAPLRHHRGWLARRAGTRAERPGAWSADQLDRSWQPHAGQSSGSRRHHRLRQDWRRSRDRVAGQQREAPPVSLSHPANTACQSDRGVIRLGRRYTSNYASLDQRQNRRESDWVLHSRARVWHTLSQKILGRGLQQ